MLKEKVVIYFAGGTMTGVFGAGVGYALQEENISSQVEAVYAGSAGVMTGAYFLSNQRQLGSSIYWENLNQGFIISTTSFWFGVWQRFRNKFLFSIPQEHLYDALDVDYVMDIIKNKKRLDIEKIFSQPIPLYVKLFNLGTYKIEYVNARKENFLDVLKAGISAFPYVHHVSVVDGSRYIDGAFMDIIGIKYLLDKHPNTRIIVVLNSPAKRKFRYKLKNILEGKFASWMLNDPLLAKPFALAENNLKKDLELIEDNPNITLIAPSVNNYIPSRTTDPKVLIRTWELGVEGGKKALVLLRN